MATFDEPISLMTSDYLALQTTGVDSPEAREFGSETQAERIPPGLLHIVENVFVLRVSLGILNRRVHARKHAAESATAIR